MVDAIYQACLTRREQLKENEAIDLYSQLKVGTKVTTRNIRPKYLAGLPAKVTKTRGIHGRGKGPHVQIDLIDYPDTTVRGRYKTTGLVVPVSCLELA